MSTNDLGAESLESDRDTLRAHVFLNLAHGEFAEMENAGSKHGICLPFQNPFGKMLDLAHAAARDNGNVHSARDCTR